MQELERFEGTLGQVRELQTNLEAARAKKKSAAEKQAEAERKRKDADQEMAALRNLQKEQPTYARTLQDAGNALSALERESETLARFGVALTRMLRCLRGRQRSPKLTFVIYF